ncbi:MAG: hypothetical protein [Malazfec virus 1]
MKLSTRYHICPFNFVSVKAFYPLLLGVTSISETRISPTTGQFQSSSAYIFTLDFTLGCWRLVGALYSLKEVQPLCSTVLMLF